MEQQREDIILEQLNSFQDHLDNNLDDALWAYDALAKYYWNRRAHEQSIRFYKKVLQLYRSKEDQGGIEQLFCLGSIAFQYVAIGDTSKAMDYLDTCLNYAKEVGDDFYLVHAFNNLGLYYGYNQDYVKALNEFKEAQLYLGSSKSDSILAAAIYGNMGRVYHSLGQYQLAEKNYRLNLDYDQKLGENTDYVVTAIQFVPTLIKRNKLSEAQRLLEAVKTELSPQNKEIKYDWLIAATHLAIAQKDSKAQDWLTEAQELSFQLNQTQRIELNKVYSEMMDKKLELSKSEAEIKRIQADQLSKKRIIRYQQLALLLLVLVTLASILVALYRKQVLERKKQLETANLQNALAEQELENEALKAAKLELELNYKDRDVTNLAMVVQEKHDLQHLWSERLKKLYGLRDLESLKKELKALMQEVEGNERIDKEKLPLKQKVDELNTAFYEKLASSYPELSKNERELCGMIRLNMTTKEIATLKNITAGSAKVMLHRLRKKLEIDSKEELYLLISRV